MTGRVKACQRHLRGPTLGAYYTSRTAPGVKSGGQSLRRSQLTVLFLLLGKGKLLKTLSESVVSNYLLNLLHGVSRYSPQIRSSIFVRFPCMVSTIFFSSSFETVYCFVFLPIRFQLYFLAVYIIVRHIIPDQRICCRACDIRLVAGTSDSGGNL